MESEIIKEYIDNKLSELDGCRWFDMGEIEKIITDAIEFGRSITPDID